MQKTTHIKPFYKEMRNAYAQMKRTKNNEKWKAIINELLKVKREYDNYVEASQKRATKAMDAKRNKMINQGLIFNGILNICEGMGYKPPEFTCQLNKRKRMQRCIHLVYLRNKKNRS